MLRPPRCRRRISSSSVSTAAGRGRRVAQEIFDVTFPSAAPHEVGIAADLPGLEETRRVRPLQRHGQPNVPGVEESDLAPMTGGSNLGVSRGHSVCRRAKPVQSLRAPTTECFD